MKRLTLLICLIILTVKTFALTSGDNNEEVYRMACETLGSDRGEVVSVDTIILKHESFFEIKSDIYDGEKCFESEVIRETRSIWKIIDQSDEVFKVQEVNHPDNSEFVFVTFK